MQLALRLWNLQATPKLTTVYAHQNNYGVPMKKVLLSLALMFPFLANAGDIGCAGLVKNQMHQVSLDRSTKTITYDNEKFRYTKSKTESGAHFTEFTAKSGKRVVIVEADTTVAFLELHGSTKVDYGYCYPQTKV